MNLLVFGLGYSAQAFVARHADMFASIAGTRRSARADVAGVAPLVFDDGRSDPALDAAIAQADVALVSIAPDEAGDPVLRACADALARASRLRRVIYLSTVGVYGDHGGGWVDETTPPRPASARSQARLAAERAWEEAAERHGFALDVLRLSGIYGPGRSAIDNLRRGAARRLVKPGQVFNRIHVDDIAGAIRACVLRDRAGAIYNVTDDEPAPPQDVVAFAAGLLGVAPPPEQDFETADLTPMARSFYGENKRVSNARAKDALGWTPLYPTYREGLRACL